MKKKTIKALKVFDKLSPTEKATTVAAGAVYVPIAGMCKLVKDNVCKANRWGKYRKKRRKKLL